MALNAFSNFPNSVNNQQVNPDTMKYIELLSGNKSTTRPMFTGAGPRLGESSGGGGSIGGGVSAFGGSGGMSTQDKTPFDMLPATLRAKMKLPGYNPWALGANSTLEEKYALRHYFPEMWG